MLYNPVPMFRHRLTTITPPYGANQKELHMSRIALVIEEDQLEAHFAANNRIHCEGFITLDNLDFYTGPWGAVIHAVNMASMGLMTKEEAHEVMDRAISEQKSLDDALDRENAA
jgi:hypothetical protein